MAMMNETREAYGTLAGMDEHTLDTVPATMPGSADTTVDDVNAPAYVLPMLSDYLLETVFGAYWMAGSRECGLSADVAALYAYAAYFVALPLRVGAWSGDRPASVLVRVVSLLVPSCVVSVDCGTSAVNPQALRLSTNDTDRRVDELIDMQLLPNRARRDAGYIRQRLATSAGVWRGRVMETGERPGDVLRTLGEFAGRRWSNVAAWMIGEVSGRVCE